MLRKRPAQLAHHPVTAGFLSLVALVALVLVTLAVVAPAQPTPGARLLDAVTERGIVVAPGHDGHVVAAGHRVCADLHAGAEPAAVTAAGVRDGIGGDLWTRRAVEVLVDQAPAVLCPTVGTFPAVSP